MKPIAPRSARPWASHGLSAMLLAWAMLGGCSSSDGKGPPSSACVGDTCVAPKPPCAKDADCDSAEFCAGGVCRADVCSQGSVECDAASGGLRVCAGNGSRMDVAGCPASHSCVADEANGAACQPWICTPGQARCTSDGKATHTCADDGFSYGKEEACSKGTSCVSGKCVKITCTPNQLLCQDGGSYVCAGDGASATLLQTCDALSFCETESGRCRSKPCSPGQTTCIDQAAATCNAAGTGYDRTECALNEVCDTGACVPTLCAPNEVYCDNAQTVKQCNPAGTVATTYITCTAGTHCSSLAGSRATCLSDNCTPGADVCDGGRATVCKMDGSGPAPGGTDCTGVGGTCSAGHCKAQACTPYGRFCYGKSVYMCSSDGSGSTLYLQCDVCNPTTAYCATQSCAPNATSCSGNSVVQCDADGLSTAVVQNCGTTNQVCVAGQCQPVVCTANTQFCKSGNGYTCNSDGTAAALSSMCSSGTYCSSGYCYADACVPGAPVCNGNALTTCKADGSGPLDAGTPCASGSTCDSGACQATVCTANGLFCSNGDVLLCNAHGDGSALYAHCFSDTYCSNGTCLPDVCPNGAPYCSGEILQSCKADGSGPVTAGTDCAASGKACSAAGCATAIVDTIGGATQSTQYASVVGEVIRTQKARKLTRVALESISTSTIKDTLVYSSTDNVNFYLLADIPGSTSVTFPAGFNDSGPLSVQLQANTYYFIAQNLGSADVYYSDQGASSASLSFATVVRAGFMSGSFTVSSSLTVAQSSLSAHMRLTTALP